MNSLELQMQLQDINLELQFISSDFHLNNCHRDELSKLPHKPALRKSPSGLIFPINPLTVIANRSVLTGLPLD